MCRLLYRALSCACISHHKDRVMHCQKLLQLNNLPNRISTQLMVLFSCPPIITKTLIISHILSPSHLFP